MRGYRTGGCDRIGMSVSKMRGYKTGGCDRIRMCGGRISGDTGQEDVTGLGCESVGYEGIQDRWT